MISWCQLDLENSELQRKLVEKGEFVGHDVLEDGLRIIVRHAGQAGSIGVVELESHGLLVAESKQRTGDEVHGDADDGGIGPSHGGLDGGKANSSWTLDNMLRQVLEGLVHSRLVVYRYAVGAGQT